MERLRQRIELRKKRRARPMVASHSATGQCLRDPLARPSKRDIRIHSRHVADHAKYLASRIGRVV